MLRVLMFRNNKILTYFFIAAIAAVCALNYELFIFPNQFAPAGLNGLCTMFQHVTGLSMGYLNLLLNIPLAILVFRLVSKTLAIRAVTYVAVFSGCLLLLDRIDLSPYHYLTDSSTIIGPLVGGIISGTATAMLLKGGAYTGGTDFISSLIHKQRPDFNFFYTSFVINCLVAVLSFFVYGYKIEPVLMCILYSFTSSTVMDKLDRASRSAIRFEIITPEPEQLGQAIIQQLHHSATLIPAKGVYRGNETNVLICVVNKSQAPLLSAIIRSIPGSFAVADTVNEVVGNFKRLDNRGKVAVELLDRGEGTGV